MKRQRSFIALLMVGIFAFNMLGYCLFSVLILTHKKSVFHKIVSGKFGKEELCNFKASEIKNVRWEHDKEFEWNEEMYDVVKKETREGDIVYTCKKDTKEDHLKKQKRKASEKSAAQKMVKLAKIFVQTPISNENAFISSGLVASTASFTEKYLFQYSPPINPPPKG